MYKERLSSILSYITLGLNWDFKTKDSKGILTPKFAIVFESYTKPGKIEISQTVIYRGMRKLCNNKEIH